MTEVQAIDWAQVYSAKWDVYRVNQDTWENESLYPGIKSIRISRSCTDDVPLLETVTMESRTEVGTDFEEGWYRIVLTARQGNLVVKEPIGTFLLESDSGKIDHGKDLKSIHGYSVLQPAKERLIIVGSYAPKGSDGAAFAAELLRECCKAPVVVEGSFTLENHVVYGRKVSYLAAVWRLLDAAAWCMRIDGDGTIHICPKPMEPSLVLDKTGMRMVMPKADYSRNFLDIPNRFTAIEGDEYEVVINDDPNSRTSTVNRKRVIDYIDDNPIRVDGETLTNYCYRQLTEMSTTVQTFTYSRDYWSGVVPYDIVLGSLEPFGMYGNYRVLSQTLNCDKGITVDETVGMEVKEYEAS